MTEINPKALWAGRALSGLAVLPFLGGAVMKFKGGPDMVQGFTHFGWPESLIPTIATLEIGSVLLYLFAPTSVLGGIVLTGFLGGALATHLRIGEPVTIHIILGFLIWGGLYLREPRLRDLLPTRAKPFTYARSVIVNHPSDKVFAYLKPLKNFQNWNPFVKASHNAQIEYRGTDGQVGFVSAWNGDRQVGAGEQEITNIVEGRKVEFELRFKKPFKATNTASFATESVGDNQTRVTWSMSGKAPFPMNVIGMFIDCEKMCGTQFEDGLSKLKNLLEK